MDSPNVLVIAVDALRADHLSCYGYERPTSPTIDALAQHGALAESFFCAGLPTHPSFTTLYTGQHPITHRIVAHVGKNELDRNAPFLPRLFVGEGYTTCALDNLMQTATWFQRGFEYYIDPSLHQTLGLAVDCEQLNARAIPWLRSHADESFFMLIHYWDPHWPLNPPPKYQRLFYDGNPTDPANHGLDPWWEDSFGKLARETWLRRPEGPVTDPAYVAALYDQEIRHLDDGIAELLGTIDELGLTDDTLVVLLGDHGESMTEHGIYFEHRGLYEATIRVPFIARWPGRIPAGARVGALLQHQDVAPMLLEAVDLDAPFDVDGASFWGLLTGRDDGPKREFVVSCECTWQAKWSLRTNRHKLILSREADRYGTPLRELYDLAADPGEERSLVDEEPELARQLTERLEGWIAEQLVRLGRDQDPIREHGANLKTR